MDNCDSRKCLSTGKHHTGITDYPSWIWHMRPLYWKQPLLVTMSFRLMVDGVPLLEKVAQTDRHLHQHQHLRVSTFTFWQDCCQATLSFANCPETLRLYFVFLNMTQATVSRLHFQNNSMQMHVNYQCIRARAVHRCNVTQEIGEIPMQNNGVNIQLKWVKTGSPWLFRSEKISCRHFTTAKTR